MPKSRRQISIGDAPKIIRSSTLASYDLIFNFPTAEVENERATSLSVGEVKVALSQLDATAPFASLKEGIECLGENFSLQSDNSDWRYNCTLDDLTIRDSGKDVQLHLGNPLLKSRLQVVFRVFVAKSLAEIADTVFKGVPLSLYSGAKEIMLDLAIQYDETNFDFFSRIAFEAGLNFWYNGESICVGNGHSGESDLILGQDCLRWNLTTKIGNEAVRIEYFDCQRNSSSCDEHSIPASAFGESHDTIVKHRKKHSKAEELTYYYVRRGDETQEAKIFGTRILRSSAANRVLLEGEIGFPLRLGSLLNISGSEEKDSLQLLVSQFSANWRIGRAPIMRFKAVSPDSLLIHRPPSHNTVKISPGLVKGVEGGNKIRVQFPWDVNKSVTPPLRTISSSAGKDTLQYMPPRANDWVLVMWGSEFADPVILGSLPVGNSLDRKGKHLALSLSDGREVIFDGSGDIKVKCGDDSMITLSSKKIVLSASEIEIKGSKVSFK